jgi:DNA modification methylase/DNA-directed RNA polymerase subunit RPC12/RpoP
MVAESKTPSADKERGGVMSGNAGYGQGFLYVTTTSTSRECESVSPPHKSNRHFRQETLLSSNSQTEFARVHSWATNQKVADLLDSNTVVKKNEYHRSPFTKDVKGSKTSTFYNAHSYPTKVPDEIIAPFIIHYTDEGDLILDPFCGSGMTGIAALKNRRKVVLRDLSPASTHIAYNYCTPVDLEAFRAEYERIQLRVREELQWLYQTECHVCGSTATVDYIVWSDVFRCPSCRSRIVYWGSAFNPVENVVRSKINCRCGEEFSKGQLEIIDGIPVRTHFYCPKCRHKSHETTKAELLTIRRIDSKKIPCWYPTDQLDKDSDMYYLCGLKRRNIESVADFYTKRNLWALSRIWNEIEQVKDQQVKRRLQFVFTSIVNRASIRYVWSPKRPLNVHVSNLYVPSIRCEFNVGKLFDRKFRAIMKAAEEALKFKPTDIRISTGSATELPEIPDGVIDYIFCDPPFGKNIFYADLHLMWEAWLRHYTDQEAELVISRARKRNPKTVQDYEQGMRTAMKEMFRVLKPEHWATMVFQNSDINAWTAVQRAAVETGFHIRGASLLDKGQYSPKQLKGITGKEKIATRDIAFNMQKLSSKPQSRPMKLADVRPKVEQIIRGIAPKIENGSGLANLYVKVIQEMLDENLDISEVSLLLVEETHQKLRK